MRARGWRPPWTALTVALAAVLAAVPAQVHAAPLPACPASATPGAWLAEDLPATVVFGRSVTVTAGVRPDATDARLELRSAGGALLAASTVVTPGPRTGAMRIFELPTPRGGTPAMTAIVSATEQRAGVACRTTETRTIRLVPGRLGRLRIDARPGGSEITIRTAAGEGCQDYLRASTVRVRLTDLTAGRHITEVFESVHPCDGWSVRPGPRSRRIALEQEDSNLVLCPAARPVAGMFRLTVTRAGRVVARGRVRITAPPAGAAVAVWVPDARRGS